MGSFLLRRTFQLIFVLWGGATLLYMLFFLLPSNPAELMASGGGSRNPDPQVVENLEKKYGLDKSKIDQYTSYLTNVVQGDLGESFRVGSGGAGFESSGDERGAGLSSGPSVRLRTASVSLRPRCAPTT